MNNYFKKIIQNRSTRILSLLFFSLLLLISYFIIHSYYVQLNIHKNKILSTLQAVSSTAATNIDANQLAYLLDVYQKKDDIKSTEQDKIYQLLHENLKQIKLSNSLNSPMYTLSYDSSCACFYFGVTSEEQPYFRHTYSNFPDIIKEKYDQGGVIDIYEDENGSWLSAFAPIKNKAGKTIAIVQVDKRFDQFISQAKDEILRNIWISLVVTAVILLLLFRTMKRILENEDKLTANLIQSKLELEETNKDLTDSIIYAKRIQDTILPSDKSLEKEFSDHFVLFSPRDIVSGDFYWMRKTRDKTFLAAVDCTGHGVPGAIMSMVGSVLLNEIIINNKVSESDQILNELHRGVVKALKQGNKNSDSKDGMDIALCVINKKAKVISFAGAFLPLVMVRNGELKRIKSTSAPIGGSSFGERSFAKCEISYEKEDYFYLFSDGYADQFGGERNKKYLTKRFRNFLLSISIYPMAKQKELLSEEFLQWKGDNEQVDDVLVFGFRV